MKSAAIFYHIHRFSLEHRLYHKDSSLLLGLSGGEDSVFLLHFLVEARRRGWVGALRAVYVDHGIRRKEIPKEIIFLENLCKSLSVNFNTITLEGHKPSFDLENHLRKSRREVLLKELNPLEKLVLAHHLNDCFEWSLRQQLRSSHLLSLLGIPLKNGPIIRPLHCVSKKQIQSFMRVHRLDFCFDSSNLDLKLERNYMRRSIVDPIESRFPLYLKHYVSRQQSLLALSKELSSTNIKVVHRRDFTYLFFPPGKVINIEQKRQILLLELKKISKVSRGTWGQQIEKFLHLIELKRPKGPLMMSGGVYLYSMGEGHVLISSLRFKAKLSELRKEILRSQIPAVLV